MVGTFASRRIQRERGRQRREKEGSERERGAERDR